MEDTAGGKDAENREDDDPMAGMAKRVESKKPWEVRECGGVRGIRASMMRHAPCQHCSEECLYIDPSPQIMEPVPPDTTIVFVLGAAGSGKSTQCRRLAEALGYTHLSSGDLLREEVERDTALGERGREGRLECCGAVDACWTSKGSALLEGMQ